MTTESRFRGLKGPFRGRTQANCSVRSASPVRDTKHSSLWPGIHFDADRRPAGRVTADAQGRRDPVPAMALREGPGIGRRKESDDEASR